MIHEAYCTRTKTINIDNIPVPCTCSDIEDCCIVRVTAGTNGYKGGDAGHGSRSVFMLQDEASTAMMARVNGGMMLEASSVLIAVGGDAELECLMDSLETAWLEMARKTDNVKHIGLTWREILSVARMKVTKAMARIARRLARSRREDISL